MNKFEFIIEEDGDSKVIFRFLPQESHCHSFNEHPPKSWDDVYKVYYAYEVVDHWIEDEEEREDLLFSTTYDECSAIGFVSNFLNNFDWDCFHHEIFTPIGSGVQWKLKRRMSNQKCGICFELWKPCNMGYRMFMTQEKAHQFGVFLNDCCEYMLAHGEPI